MALCCKGIDAEFERLLDSIFGTDAMQSFKHKRPADWICLQAGFESRKRAANRQSPTPLNIPLPFSFIEFYRKYTVCIYIYAHFCSNFYIITKVSNHRAVAKMVTIKSAWLQNSDVYVGNGFCRDIVLQRGVVFLQWKFCLLIRPFDVCTITKGKNLLLCYYTVWKDSAASFRSPTTAYGGDHVPCQILIESAPCTLFKNRGLRHIFARNVSAVKASKNSVITNRKLTTSFSTSLRRSAYVVPKFSKKG